MIYLDNAASTAVHPEVVKEMLPYFDVQYGNPSSIHQFGRKAKNAVQKARKQVAALIGAEPAEADDAYRSLELGEIQVNETTNTICDGLRAQIGSVTFPIIKEKVDGIIIVTENEIINSMRMIWERMKIIVEPSSTITLAAILKRKELFKGQKVGLILSGGNVDLTKLPF